MSQFPHDERELDVSGFDRENGHEPAPKDDSWLVRPSSIRLLWRVFAVVLVLSVAVQLLFKVKGYFGVDGWLGFGAAFGFLSCLVMVLFAKVLGVVLKREGSYYRERDDD